MQSSTWTEERGVAPDKAQRRLDRLQQQIAHAADLLPAQGPITSFVHHNTLHAFEALPFEEAVVQGGETFGCHPFLPEERYRDKLLRGRIRREDIEAVLIDDLGDRGDELLGFLGTRFHLRMGMLAHRWRTGPAAELRWVVAETDALRRFREETPLAVRDSLVAELQEVRPNEEAEREADKRALTAAPASSEEEVLKAYQVELESAREERF